MFCFNEFLQEKGGNWHSGGPRMVSRDNAVKNQLVENILKRSVWRLFLKKIFVVHFYFRFSYFLFLPEMDDFVFLYGSYNDCNWIGSGENSDCISSTRLTETIFLFSSSHGFLLFTLSRDECSEPKSMCVHCPVTGCVRVGQRRAAVIHRWSDIIQRTFITTSFSITKALLLRNLCLYTLLLFLLFFFFLPW